LIIACLLGHKLLANWFVKIVVAGTIVLAVLGLVSYVVTFNSLVFWTLKADEAGNIGGVLDYRWFGLSTIFHITLSKSLEAVYSFPDTTSYLILTIIAFNLTILLFTLYRSRSRPYWVKIRNLTISSITIAALALWVYAEAMMFIDSSLKQFGGGVVTNYGSPYSVSVYGVYEGQFASEPETIVLNYTILLLALLILAVSVISLRPNRKQTSRKTEETVKERARALEYD
jgi:hypothetical protein